MDHLSVDAHKAALSLAIDYHSRIYGPVNMQDIAAGQKAERPSDTVIVETAKKFATFLVS